METVYGAQASLENTANGGFKANFEVARSLTIQKGADCVFFLSSQLFYKINRG
jgi:hypothetical protein